MINSKPILYLGRCTLLMTYIPFSWMAKTCRGDPYEASCMEALVRRVLVNMLCIMRYHVHKQDECGYRPDVHDAQVAVRLSAYCPGPHYMQAL
jgi:hypothetical protein